MGGITNLTTALTGEGIVGLHRGLQILVHYCSRHGGLEMKREIRKDEGEEMSRCRDLYVYICVCSRMYIAMQSVRCPISRQQAVGSWFVG